MHIVGSSPTTAIRPDQGRYIADANFMVPDKLPQNLVGRVERMLYILRRLHSRDMQRR